MPAPGVAQCSGIARPSRAKTTRCAKDARSAASGRLGQRSRPSSTARSAGGRRRGRISPIPVAPAPSAKRTGESREGRETLPRFSLRSGRCAEGAHGIADPDHDASCVGRAACPALNPLEAFAAVDPSHPCRAGSASVPLMGPRDPGAPPGAAAPPSADYLDRLMRRGSFEALWPLFANATRPAKELTESFSALEHLRPFISESRPYRVLHVGDGAHCRTGAMFALRTSAENISVDPAVNEPLVEAWRARFGIRRLGWRKSRLEDAAAELNALPAVRTLVTFVHAHVSVDDALASLRWDAAFVLACCVPGNQLSRRFKVVRAGEDASVLSAGRGYQVLLNER